METYVYEFVCAIVEAEKSHNLSPTTGAPPPKKKLVEKFNPSPKTWPGELVQNLGKISKVQEQEYPMKWGLMFCSNS